jgi:hypothetical protein
MDTCCNPTDFDFKSNIPNIINAYKNGIPVKIFIPATKATLTISFISTYNNYKNITNDTDAINYARQMCILYLSKITYVTIPQLNCSIPCTSARSIALIKQYSIAEDTSVLNNDIASS